MLRLGFFLGFLLGAGAGALLSQQETAGNRTTGRPADRLKATVSARLDQARQAAKEEARATEEKMLRDFEKATHPEEGKSA